MQVEKTYVGNMYLAPDSDLISKRIRAGERYEKPSLDIVGQYLKEDMIVVDVGAHMGLYSVFAAQKVGKGKVYAFEPALSMYKYLMHNACLYSQIVPIPVGLSDTVGRFQDAKGFWSFCIKGDDYFEPIQCVHFLKVDVNGITIRVLRGLSELIRRSPSVLAVIELGGKHMDRVGNSSAELFDLLESLQFDYGRIALTDNFRLKGIDLCNQRKQLSQMYFKDHCNLLAWKNIQPFWKVC